MACVVLLQNPQRGGVLAITDEDGDEIAHWPTVEAAKAAISDHLLVKAWGGFVVDLDAEEVHSI